MNNKQKIHSLTENEEISFVIPVAPVTKKNSQRIIVNSKNGKRQIIPSAPYKKYENEAILFVPKLHISSPVNVKAVFYMKSRRKTDLVNLIEALHDVLVISGCVEDDNCTIITSTDGSRVKYDKNNPRTEVTITKSKENVFPEN